MSPGKPEASHEDEDTPGSALFRTMIGEVAGADSTRSWNVGPRRGVGRPADYLVLGLTCDQPLLAPARYSLEDIDEVLLGRGHERTGRRGERPARRLSVTVPDPWMSSRHAKLARTDGRWMLEDGGSKNGCRVNGWRVRSAALADGDLIELGCTFLLFRRNVAVVGECEDLDLADPPPGDLATCSPPLERQLAALARMARTDATVLVTGETGTGKEVLARAIHARSRATGPFVAVNCGALPAGLVESQLFGHRKGAFSGATTDQVGLVRSADGGTLFLDEIGDLPLPAQTAMLRVLQEGEVLPVGGTRPVRVAVRVLAATHRDVDAMVAAGDFRADLLGRVVGFRVELPPLRERKEDLGLLLAALLRRHAGADAARVTFTPEAARLLYRHGWPLNVRELEKCVAAALALAHGEPIHEMHLQQILQPGGSPHPDSRERPPFSEADLERREQLIRLLGQHRGNVTAVAAGLGKARMQIQRWLKRYGIDPKTFRD